MTKLLNCIGFLFIVFPINLFAQNDLNIPHIRVTGIAEMNVVPNEIYISILLAEKVAGKEVVTVGSQENELKKCLRALGVDLGCLKVSGVNTMNIKVSKKQSDATSQINYVLKVSDVLVLKNVFVKLDELKVESAYIMKVDHSQISTYMEEVRKLAIVSAKNKAEYLLGAIGETVGRTLYVGDETRNRALTIGGFFMDDTSISNNEYRQFTEVLLDDEIKNEPEHMTIRLTASIEAIFQIK